MSFRIDALTNTQLELLPKIRDEWLGHGLSCQPADRAAAEAGVVAAYKAAKLPPPPIRIWLDSPFAGAVGMTILPETLKRLRKSSQVETQLGQVGSQVEAQVRGQVGAQVGDQVRAQVGGQVWGQVWGQVGSQVMAQVGTQIGGQVRNQIRGQVEAQVGDQVRAPVEGQVRAQVRAQVWEQVRDQVWAQVRAQVRAQVWDQVGSQVEAQVGDQVGAQVWAQIEAQVGDQVELSLWGQHDAEYMSFFDAFDRLGLPDITAPTLGLRQVAKTAGWWWALRGAVILTERPRQLHRDAQGRLHHPSGPALAYPDGWAIWAIHGVRVPQAVVEQPDTITVPAILNQTNTEIRRVMIEQYGWDRFAADADLRLVDRQPDPGNPGHDLRLYDLPARLLNTPVRLLVCHNASPERDGHRRVYGLTVDRQHTDAVAAAASTFGVDPADYRQLARAT